MVEHYRRSGGIFDRVLDRLAAAGIATDSLTESALSGVDEFHAGGRPATLAVLEALALDPGAQVVDLGCGIGGPGRTLAALGYEVVGVDLTPEFVDVATRLTSLVGLDELATFEVGDATATRFADESFDGATVFHVGMNIEDKSALAAEIARLLRPGGRAAVYDIMRTGEGELTYPVPWAASPAASHVEASDAYVDALTRAGLVVERTGSFAPRLQAFRAAAHTQPGLDLSVLMGEGFPAMFANMIGAVGAGIIAPTLVVAAAPA